MKSKRILTIVLCLLILWPVTVGAATIKSNFDWIIAKRLTVTNGNVVIGAGNLSVSGSDTVGTFRIDTPAIAITVTPGGTVTPLGSYQPLTAAATGTGTSAIAGCATATAGERVTFVNTSANTITFTDTGTLKLSGNAVLGQTDTLVLLCDGTNWNQLGKSDN